MKKLKNWQWILIVIVTLIIISKLPEGFLGAIVPPEQKDNFQLSNLQVSGFGFPGAVPLGNSLDISLTVTNPGSTGGDNSMKVECGLYDSTTGWLYQSILPIMSIYSTPITNCFPEQTNVKTWQVNVPLQQQDTLSASIAVPTSFDTSRTYLVWCEAFENCAVNGDVLQSSKVMSSTFNVIGTSTGPSCTNAIQDGDETDVDCGGSSCPDCLPMGLCEVDSDCMSGYVCSVDNGFDNNERCVLDTVAPPPDDVECSSDAECNDGVTTTTDKCVSPGTTSSYCTHTPTGCTPCTKPAQAQNPTTCVCTDILPPGSTCKSDADCTAPKSFCVINIDTKVQSCEGFPFQVYNISLFWGNKVVSGEKPEVKFSLRNTDVSTKSTFLEMAYYSESSAFGKTIATAAGPNIQSILGFDNRLNEVQICQPTEDFVMAAELKDVKSLEDLTFALNPKVPTKDSKYSGGATNWDTNGVYWMITGTYRKDSSGKCLPWDFVRATKVTVVPSECTSDSGCSKDKPYCRFGLCRTESDVKRTLTGESLGEGCILAEGGTFTNCAGGGGDCVSPIRDDDLKYASGDELKKYLCGEVSVSETAALAFIPVIGPVLAHSNLPVKLECCGSAKCQSLDTLPESVQDRVKTFWTIDDDKGVCVEEYGNLTNIWDQLKAFYDEFKMWVWVAGIFLVLIIILRLLSPGKVAKAAGSLFR